MIDLVTVIREHQGPPVNIEGIIRSMGIELDKRADLMPEISGQLEKLQTGKYKISVNKTDHYYRQRFTMAHELGHYVFHLHLIGEGVDDNRAYRSTAEGAYYNRQIQRAEETEANRFAASLLMPDDLVSRLAQDGETTESLARLFQVSNQAMEIRITGLRKLGALP